MIVSENRCGICKHIHVPGEVKCGWIFGNAKVCTCVKSSLSNMNKMGVKQS